MIKQYKLRFYNFRLLLFLLAISSIGVVLVGTAREDLMLKQLMGVIMGLVIMVILSLTWARLTAGFPCRITARKQWKAAASDRRKGRPGAHLYKHTGQVFSAAPWPAPAPGTGKKQFKNRRN